MVKENVHTIGKMNLTNVPFHIGKDENIEDSEPMKLESVLKEIFIPKKKQHLCNFLVFQTLLIIEIF